LGAEKTLTLPVTSTNNPNIFSLESQLGQVEGIEPLAMGTGVGVIPGSAAYKAGIRSGDEIVSVNGEKVRLWTDLENRLQSAKQNISIEVERPSAELDENDLPKSKSTLKFEIAQKDLKSSLVELGLEQPQLYLGSVVKGSPAAEAGIQPYDKIVAINSKPVTKWLEVLETIKAYDGKEPLNISIVRPQSDNVDQAVAAKTEIVKKVTPKVTEQTTAFGATDKRYTLGIITSMSYAEPEMVKVAASNPIEALVNGTIRTVDVSVMTMMSFVKLFQGQVSPKNLGGMVSIGKVAKDSFEVGPQAFFMTMGILSVSLFILNLMPIPVLDGGHLVFYVIEVIKGSPLSLKKMEIAQQVGFVLLLGLMILAQFNDIVKFLFKS
jgi:regulator of sigma E protease